MLTMALFKKDSFRFIVLLGVVSLLADVTYEGARSITGPFLSLLGASGTAVGVIVGLGELVGYGMRVLFGYISDKTKAYWPLTLVGYFLNLMVVPLLALVPSWPWAAFLLVLERFGKAVRTPARDTMLSYATQQTGHGFGFGLHEALDQIGAIAGPLFLSALLFVYHDYRLGFASLLLPALFALLVLVKARSLYPKPQEMERARAAFQTKGLTKTYWLYLCAIGLVGAGYADFAFIAYHFQKNSVLSSTWIPLFYSIAMTVDGAASLFMGRLFDMKGTRILALVTAVSALFAPFVFFGGFYASLVGIVLWGIGMGAQESLMRAVIAALVPSDRRGSAYGMMNLVFGLCWAVGSALMGVLYDSSLLYVVLFSVITQLLAVPLFLSIRMTGR